MTYEESKQALLDDLRSMPDNGKIRIFWGVDAFTLKELIKEIEDETEVGIEHIEMHIGAMELIAELKARPPKKKLRWRIGKRFRRKR